MSFDKVALFNATKALWPASIDVLEDSDATNRIYWANEAAVPLDDEWRQLALWAFHQALLVFEREAVANGLPLRPQDVSFVEFDRWMRFNLKEDCFTEERAEYDRT